MIFRKPTVIQIKAEEDMQDIQPPNRNTNQFTPSNPLKGKLQDLRNQMDIERNPHHSPYSNDLLYQSLMSNIRDEADEGWSIIAILRNLLELALLKIELNDQSLKMK